VVHHILASTAETKRGLFSEGERRFSVYKEAPGLRGQPGVNLYRPTDVMQHFLELREHRDAQVAVVRDVVPLYAHRGVAPHVEIESKV